MGQSTEMSPRVSMLDCHSSEFLEVQISPRVLVMAGIRRCPVSSARSAQKFGGKNKKKTLYSFHRIFVSLRRFSLTQLHLHFGTLSHLAP